MEHRVVDELRKVDGGSTGNVMDESIPRTKFIIGERAHISKTVSDADVELFAKVTPCRNPVWRSPPAGLGN